MRFLALDTNVNNIKERFCSSDECEVLMTYYHGLSFLFAIIREVVISIVLVSLAAFAWWLGWPMVWVSGILFSIWVLFAFFNILKAWIDWRYDFIFVTTDKIVLVDQTSFLKQEVKPIHIENIGSVGSETQFWNLFNFGKIVMNLKEGLGGEHLTLKYVPNASAVAARIADVVTNFQRRQGNAAKQATAQQIPPA